MIFNDGPKGRSHYRLLDSVNRISGHYSTADFRLNDSELRRSEHRTVVKHDWGEHGSSVRHVYRPRPGCNPIHLHVYAIYRVRWYPVYVVWNLSGQWKREPRGPTPSCLYENLLLPSRFGQLGAWLGNLEASYKRHTHYPRWWRLLACYPRCANLRKHLPLCVQLKLRLYLRIRHLLLHDTLFTRVPNFLQQYPSLGRQRPLQHLRDRNVIDEKGIRSPNGEIK